jgi:hypothetical protein
VTLCTAAAVNVAAWRVSATRLGLSKEDWPADVYATRRLLLWLSAIYVLGCGFRSVLPMVDIPRICLHDTWISRIAVGRTVATIAELAFAAQWAILLREAGTATGSRLAYWVSRTLVPLIVVAELCSWSAVLTTNNLLHAAENSLWMLGAVLTVAAFLVLQPRVDARSGRVLAVAVVCGTAYVAYMVIVDVPMYLARWHADFAAGHPYLSPGEGMRNVLQRCVVTREWAAWREDVPWLTLYFTFAVWVSIAMAHVPPFRRQG